MEKITYVGQLQVNHQNVFFTIDEGLRYIFLLHRHLLMDLMDATSKLITDFFHKKAMDCFIDDFSA